MVATPGRLKDLVNMGCLNLKVGQIDLKLELFTSFSGSQLLGAGRSRQNAGPGFRGRYQGDHQDDTSGETGETVFLLQIEIEST